MKRHCNPRILCMPRMEMNKRKAAAGNVGPTAPHQVSWKIYVWPLAILVATGSIYLYQKTGKYIAPPLLVVQREKLTGRTYREVVELRRPMILTETIADKWQARHSFTPSFLAQKLPYVMAHKQESTRSFMTFHDDKPLESLVEEKWEDFNVKVNVTLPEVLNWDREDEKPSSGPYLYFSQDITTLRSMYPDIMDHVHPLTDLILSTDNVQVNLWIGRAGIVTHTHYDCTFNFFVQLQGRKRFTLFPPDSPLYLYPCLHPHYGHSQVDILNPELSIFPDYLSDGAWVADVGPGDMLVVPPFWFHHVETLEQSVSVNVWSDAPEYALINQIYEQPIPFEENWSWNELATATRIYIDMLFQAVAVPSSQEFINKLLSQRYDPIVLSGNLNVNDTAMEKVQSFCSSVQWADEKTRLIPFLRRGIKLLEPLFALITNRGTQEICLGNYVEHLLHLTVDLENVGTQEICLGNYVKHLFHLTVDLENVYPFLKNCFKI